jgi:ABC-type bacteriocin/lantibiotic exporter with double-glycine peptidase domain
MSDPNSKWSSFQGTEQGQDRGLISHRFSSFRMADGILVLSGDRVEAAGTPEELLA